VAAASLFHIVSNHPFVDGRKRAGLLAALDFVDVDGGSLEHDSETCYGLTMGVAEGRLEKAAVANELARIAKSKHAT
jgi:death-on-curing protein